MADKYYTLQFSPRHFEKLLAGLGQRLPCPGGLGWGAHLDLLEEVGAAELLCYFFLFLLTKVRRSMAVTTPNTICFMKELPFPLTGSTENSSLVVKK